MTAREERSPEPRAPGAEAPGCPAAVVRAAAKAHAALQELVETAAIEAVGRSADHLDTAGLAVRWQPGATAAELAEETFRFFAESISESRAFSSGRAYCYACGGSDCAHATPVSPGEVFTGYESTGRPRWQEFFGYLLELADERADRLFLQRAELLARVVGRTRLVADQLTTFGRNSFTYRVWGQVVAGYLQVRDCRAALTAQIVEDKRHQLHLQVIASPLLREALADAPEDRRSAFARVYDALAESRNQLATLGSVWQHGNRREMTVEAHEKAFAILRHLAHSIEQKGRQQQRRTSHAEIRGGQNRPVHKAYDDVVAATAQDIYTDRFKQSIIVAGRSGRIHAFSREGRHITSLVLAGDEFDRRCAHGRYVPYAEGDAEVFRASVLAALPALGEDDAPAPGSLQGGTSDV